MNDRVNKTSICSISFLDIVDYSKKTDSEQIEIKKQFNNLINLGLKDVAQDDRIVLDTGDGAAIAYKGSPEEALFSCMTIRDEILKSNIHSAMPLYVRLGINLGPVRHVSDINGQPNIIGDGINVAQRIMSFANPNQILVSRSYYEVVSRLTHEISQMFDYSGVKNDKHMREHEIYSVRLMVGDKGPVVIKADSKSRLESIQKWVFASLTVFLSIVLLWQTNNTQQQKVQPINTFESKVPLEQKTSQSTEQSVTEDADSSSLNPNKKNQVKLSWDKMKQSMNKGAKEPNCSPAQKSMKHCN